MTNKKYIVKELVSNKIFVAIMAFIVLVVVLYFLFIKKENEDKKSLQDLNKDLSNLNQSSSYSATQFNSYADTIEDNLNKSGIDDSKSTVEDILIQMNNTADILSLIKAYGKRQRYLFGIPDGEKTSLPETIRDEFFTYRVNRVNKNYELKGIKFQF